MRLSFLICVLALGLAAPALAEDAPASVVQLFVSPMGEPFRADGTHPYPSAAWFAQADANHDGVISRAEFRADAQRFFKVLDVNHDGRLTEPEIVYYEVRVAPEIVASTRDTSGTQAVEDSQGRKQPIQLETGQGASVYGLIDSPEPVRAADADFNNKITLDEWMAAAGRRYRLLVPEDKDGLRLADMPKTTAQIFYDKQLHRR